MTDQNHLSLETDGTLQTKDMEVHLEAGMEGVTKEMRTEVTAEQVALVIKEMTTGVQAEDLKETTKEEAQHQEEEKEKIIIKATTATTQEARWLF